MSLFLHDSINASIASASGSGCQATNLANCLLMREANKSISGKKKVIVSF